MGPLCVVVIHPRVQVGLEIREIPVDPLAEGHLVELLLHRPVEPFADAIGLRTVGLRPGVIDVVDGQVELVVVSIPPATELAAPIGQDS